jgi:hypothetical protein
MKKTPSAKMPAWKAYTKTLSGFDRTHKGKSRLLDRLKKSSAVRQKKARQPKRPIQPRDWTIWKTTTFTEE